MSNIFFVKLCTQSDSVIHQQPVASLVDDEKKRVSEAARRAKTCRKLELDFSYEMRFFPFELKRQPSFKLLFLYSSVITAALSRVH